MAARRQFIAGETSRLVAGISRRRDAIAAAYIGKCKHPGTARAPYPPIAAVPAEPP